MVIAHRGTPQKNPDHSIAGYRQAVSQGSIFLELDLQLSKDGILYVAHSNNLKKLAGKNITISKSKAKTIDKAKMKNGENVHRLSEIFRVFGKTVFYVIETKTDGNGGKTRRMDNRLLKLIGKYGVEKRVMIQSLSLGSLKRIHKKYKRIPYMYITYKIPKKRLPKTVAALPKFIDVVSVSLKDTTPSLRKKIHQRKMKLALFTVKSKKNMKKAVAAKPDQIFTDNTGMSIKYLKGA
jgi:glycerophosphoryl diester phosphodiesterase